MREQDLEDEAHETAHWHGSDAEDDAEPTSPRFAVGTREIAPLVSPTARPHHDLPYADVAKIVHDLKGPLGTIGLEAELLGENLAAGAAVDAAPILGRIMRNVGFLDRLVMDLLDMCMLDAGRFELHRVPTELRMLLDQVIERVVPTRDRERVFLDARTEVMVDIDDLRIERVVANLLQNALEYAPVGTGIIVRLDREPHVARISVIDAGDGLTLELAKVFQEYKRGTLPGSRSGIGLGLFLSQQIIEAHGATIGVDSIRGEGTRFYFELPTIP
jgi:signal transduction histidine kinase